MEEAIAQPESPRAPASSPFLLEAHYYDGGLRVKPLGGMSTRPDWVPPGDYVGFRNEVALERTDVVVEFARFRFKQRRVTWVGVFARSVDQVFGDRQNHAGVGLWLLERDVADPLLLLDPLRQFARMTARGETDAVEKHARQFAGESYLPAYLKPTPLLPQQLAGWPFSTTAMPETALFMAAAPDENEALALAAEQILRMSLLPAEGGHARALILVRPDGNAVPAQATPAGAMRLRKGLLSDLIGQLPVVLRSQTEENERLTATVGTVTERLASAEAQLADAQERREGLQARAETLEKQLGENQILARLGAIELGLKELSRRSEALELRLKEVRKDLAAIRPEARTIPPVAGYAFPQPAPAAAENEPVDLYGMRGLRAKVAHPGRDRGYLVFILYLAAGSLALALLYLVWDWESAAEDAAAPAPLEQRAVAPAAPATRPSFPPGVANIGAEEIDREVIEGAASGRGDLDRRAAEPRAQVSNGADE